MSLVNDVAVPLGKTPAGRPSVRTNSMPASRVVRDLIAPSSPISVTTFSAGPLTSTFCPPSRNAPAFSTTSGAKP